MRLGVKIGCVMAVMQIFFVVMAVTICVYMFRNLITGMQKESCSQWYKYAGVWT